MEQKTEASQAVKFRKKPVEIEAIQWTGKLECLDAFNIPELHQSLGSKNVGIPTLEGTMIAHVGDWIIKGVKGEFYPCKPDIFELTYEHADLKAQPAPTSTSVPAMYQQHMIAPNGNAGTWRETPHEMYERYSANPDIGDGFKYEVRALHAGQPAPTDPLPAQAAMKGNADSLSLAQEWTQQPPTAQADYWHWNGSEHDAPGIVSVMYSPSGYFVASNCTHSGEAEMCHSYGGWWMRIEQPDLPGEEAQLSGNSGELANKQVLENIEQVQGEDSARLDAYQLESMSYLCGCKACNQIMTGRMMFICGKCGDKNCPGATNHLNKCIDRARASAETGGVKP